MVLIGYGNVGFHIADAFRENDAIELLQIYSRSLNTSIDNTIGVPATSSLKELLEADVYILAVPDKAVVKVSNELPFKNRLVVHTSGSVAMDALDSKNYKGVWYPLQTFSKSKKISFSNIPVCVEAERTEDTILLERLGKLVSTSVQKITSQERASLHLAAVFANNFSNHMYEVAQQIVSKKGVDFSLLRPLIEETAKKINTLLPSEAQTGPAARNDTQTIEKHLAALDNEDHKKLYTFITESIQKKLIP